MEKFLRKLFVKKKVKVNLTEKYYLIGLIGIPAIGIVFKNILLQAFLLGKTKYQLSLGEAVLQTWKYWIIYLAIAMLILGFSLIFSSEKIRKIYILLTDILLTVLIYCDLIYNRSFYTMPSAVNLSMLTNLEGMGGGEITSLLSWYDLFLIIDIVMLIVYLVVVKYKKKDDNSHKRRFFKSYLVTTIVCIIILCAIPVQAKTLKVSEDIYEKMYLTTDSNNQAKYFTSLGFHAKDIYEILEEKISPEISSIQEDKVNAFFNRRDNSYIDQYEGIYKDKNVIFLQIESLESFVINNEINGQEITPNINKLIKKGMYFRNIFEEVKCGNSSDADLMYTTSILPASKGCTFFRYADIELNSLPRILNGQGYLTTYHQAIGDKFWNYLDALTNMIGFKQFYGKDQYDMSDMLGFTLSDESFLKQTFNFVKKNKQPFYSHIVCNSSHMPFNIQDGLKGLDLPKQLEDTYLGNYFQCINYVDRQLGSFIEQLDNLGMLENTIIVIAGDHTGIHKYYEHKISKYYEDYPWCDISGAYTVPLVIFSKDTNTLNSALVSVPYESEVIGGQIDVMPTILYLMGLNTSENLKSTMGKNLFDSKKSYGLFRDGSIVGDIQEDYRDVFSTGYEVSDIIFRELSK